jgi:hypothetical protein
MPWQQCGILLLYLAQGNTSQLWISFLNKKIEDRKIEDRKIEDRKIAACIILSSIFLP